MRFRPLRLSFQKIKGIVEKSNIENMNVSETLISFKNQNAISTFLLVLHILRNGSDKIEMEGRYVIKIIIMSLHLFVT